jgi:hypothetical protein
MVLILLEMREVDILPNMFGRLSSLRVSVKLKVKVSLSTPWRYIEWSRGIAPSILDLSARSRRGMTH